MTVSIIARYKLHVISLSKKMKYAAFFYAPRLYVNLSLARQKRRNC